MNRTTSSDILTVLLCRERNTLRENCTLKSSWMHSVLGRAVNSPRHQILRIDREQKMIDDVTSHGK